MMKRSLVAVTIGLLLSLSHAQAQQNWPSQPLRIIVPFAPGAFTDIAARSLANVLTPQLGQPVVVDNRTGAGGTIGTEVVAHAAADGYTLLLSDNSFAISASLYSKLPYDPVKDFIQVSEVAEAPPMLVGRVGLPGKSLKDLVELARSQPGKITFGSGGQGSSAHLAMELFLDIAGIKMTHVPFRGAAVAMTETVAGHIDSTIASIALGMPYVRAGKVYGLAVGGKARSPQLPDVPTFAEAGFPKYDFMYWWGIAARSKTPPQIVARLNREIARALDDAKLKKNFENQGAVAVSSSSGDFSQRVHQEMSVWKKMIGKLGLKVE